MEDPPTIETLPTSKRPITSKKKTKKRSSKKKTSVVNLDQTTPESSNNSKILKPKNSPIIPKVDDTCSRLQPPTPNSSRMKNLAQAQLNRPSQSELEPMKSNSITYNSTASSIESTCNAKQTSGLDSQNEEDLGDALVKTNTSKEIKTSNVPRMVPSVPKTEKSHNATISNTTSSGSLKIPRLRANSARNVNKFDIPDHTIAEEKHVHTHTSKILKTPTQIKKPSLDLQSNKNVPHKNSQVSSSCGKNLFPEPSIESTSTLNEYIESEKQKSGNTSPWLTPTRDPTQTSSTLADTRIKSNITSSEETKPLDTTSFHSDLNKVSKSTLTETTKAIKKLQVSKISRDKNIGIDAANISEQMMETNKVHLDLIEKSFSTEVNFEGSDSIAVSLKKSLDAPSLEITPMNLANQSSCIKYSQQKNGPKLHLSDDEISAPQPKPLSLNILIGPDGNIISTAVTQQQQTYENSSKKNPSDFNLNAVGALTEGGFKFSVDITDLKLLMSTRRTDDMSTDTYKAEELQAINRMVVKVSNEITSSSINGPVVTLACRNIETSVNKDVTFLSTTKDDGVELLSVSKESIDCLHKKVDSIEKSIQKMTAALSIHPLHTLASSKLRPPSRELNISDCHQETNQISFSCDDNMRTDFDPSKVADTKIHGKSSAGWKLMWPFRSANIGPTTDLAVKPSYQTASRILPADKGKAKNTSILESPKKYKVIGRVGRE